MPDWQNYWAERSHGGHRNQNDENFLSLEAKEKLFHLGSGESLLDFGCGSADLLVYYAPVFRKVLGADFSPSMLAHARQRLEQFPALSNVRLLQADDVTIWKETSERFDCITLGQVVQYLDEPRLAAFLEEARGRLNPGGRVVLFDVIDPQKYFLQRVGLLENRAPQAVAKTLLRGVTSRLRRLKSGTPGLGHRYCFAEIAGVAASAGLEARLVWSMYYEYRYHVILTEGSADVGA